MISTDTHVPAVAIITRTKDRNLLLPRAIESVLGQSCGDWLHVIVNDGGDRQALEQLLQPYEARYDGRLHVIHHEQSKGMEAASNAGIKASDSCYVAVHDDDDQWAPQFLEACLKELAECQLDAAKGVVSRIVQVFETIDGDAVREVRRQSYNPGLAAISLPLVAEINPFLPIAFLFERAVFEDVGFYDETLPVVGDWEFNLRFLSRYDIIVLPAELAFYHVREQAGANYQNSVAKDGLHARYRAAVVNRYMRRDMASGEFGLGAVLAMAEHLYRANKDMARIGRILDKMKSLSLVSKLRQWLRL